MFCIIFLLQHFLLEGPQCQVEFLGHGADEPSGDQRGDSLVSGVSAPINHMQGAGRKWGGYTRLLSASSLSKSVGKKASLRVSTEFWASASPCKESPQTSKLPNPSRLLQCSSAHLTLLSCGSCLLSHLGCGQLSNDSRHLLLGIQKQKNRILHLEKQPPTNFILYP